MISSEKSADSVCGSTEVLIVGAGPIGIELAVALKHSGIKCQIFDAGTIGNTIAWWAPQTRWFSSNERIAIAGTPLLTIDQSKATREQYLTYLRGVVTQHNLTINTQCPVRDIRRDQDGFIVDTSPTRGLESWRAQTVVLAIGGTDFPRRLGIPGENLPHVDGYLRETHRYHGRRVMIIGGRNSAIEAAIRLHHAGAKVSLSYRGEALPEDGIKYWLRPEIEGLLASGRIADYTATQPIEFTPNAVRLKSLTDGTISEIPADDVLSLIGYEQDKTLMQRVGVQLIGEMQRPQHDESTMQTDVPGIYVAGTATAGTQNSKYKTFLENCHDHVDKIVAHLTGKQVHKTARDYSDQIAAQPES